MKFSFYVQHQIPSGLQSVDPPQNQYMYQTVQQYDDTVRLKN